VTAPSESTIALVIGPKQSGKSYLVKRGLGRLTRFVVWDVKGEYADPQLGVRDARLWTSLRAWREHLLAGGKVQREVFACPEREFEPWCRWVMATGNLVVVVEELSRYCTGNRPPPFLDDLFNRSRHFPIDLIATTARPTRVFPDLRSQVDEAIVARMSEPNDLAYLTEWLGEPAVARIRQLEPLRFIRTRP